MANSNQCLGIETESYEDHRRIFISGDNKSDECCRHVLLSSGPFLTEPMWNISAQCLERTFTITTYSVRQLMTLFHPNSDNFYGDIGQVKVATRKDCVAMDSIRLRQLAQQVCRQSTFSFVSKYSCNYFQQILKMYSRRS